MGYMVEMSIKRPLNETAAKHDERGWGEAERELTERRAKMATLNAPGQVENGVRVEGEG